MKDVKDILCKYSGKSLTEKLIDTIIEELRTKIAVEFNMVKSEGGEKEAVVAKVAKPESPKLKFKAIVSIPDPIPGRLPEEGDQDSVPVKFTEKDN